MANVATKEVSSKKACALSLLPQLLRDSKARNKLDFYFGNFSQGEGHDNFLLPKARSGC